MRNVEIDRTNLAEDHIKRVTTSNGEQLTIMFTDLQGCQAAKQLLNSFSDHQYILLCYAVDSERTLESVRSDWLTEINSNAIAKDAPIALIATKKDLREDEPENCITDNRGRLVQREINQQDQTRCKIFRETSAWEDVHGITQLFKDLADDIIAKRIYTEELLAASNDSNLNHSSDHAENV